MKAFRFAAILLAVVGYASAAQATIVNISGTLDPFSATNTSPIASQFFKAGTYNISVVDNSAAAGGYNGWTAYTPIASQTAPYREAFIFSTDGGATRTGFDVYGGTSGYYTSYATTTGGVKAFQTASSYAQFVNGSLVGPVSTMQLVLKSDTDVLFSVPDNAGQFGDNTGGVSLSITSVPEPTSAALALGGLVALTGVSRRRKSA